MAEQSAIPDYDLADELELTETAQHRALFDETRMKIVDLLLERAATTSDLAIALDKPKGTVGHHLKVLDNAGLVHVVRTKRVRAIEAKYYGRTARTFLFHTADSRGFTGVGPGRGDLLAAAAVEADAVPQRFIEAELPTMSTSRYARIPAERAEEWSRRLAALTLEFVSEPREGDVTYGLVVGFYPTDRPRLPDPDDE